MYYPWFTKVIIHHFMSKDPSIPRRNKVNWHYVRGDHMFSTIKLVSRHQNTQQFGALVPIELTNEEIKNFIAYKEYYAVATGAATPKQKANEGTGSILGVLDVPTDESEEELSWISTEHEGDDEGKDGKGDDDNGDDDDEKDDEDEGGDGEQEYDEEEYDEEIRDGESFDPIPKTPKNSDDEGNYEEDLGLNVGREEGNDEEEEEDELYRDVNINQGRERHVEEEEEDELFRDVNINQGRGLQASLEVKDSYVTLTPVNPDGSSRTPTSVAPLPMTAPTMTPSTISTITTTSQAPILPKIVLSNIIQNLPNFGLLFRFDDRLRSLETNFSEAMQTNQFAGAVSAILRIVQRFMDQRMNKAVKVAVQIKSGRLRVEAQRENDEFLKTVNENIKKIIKEQVKEQVKVQVSKILPRIKQTVNKQLKAEVLTRSSHSSRTSYAVAADLSEMELKKILIENMEGNKPDRVSKRRREEKEPESASAPMKTATRSAGRSTQGSRSRQASASEFALAEDPMQTTSQMEEPSHLSLTQTVPAVHESIQSWINELTKQADTRCSFNELMDTPLDFSNFLINQLKVDTLTLEILAGPRYKLMKGLCKSLVELEHHLEKVSKATTNQLDWVNPEGASSRKYTTSIKKTKAADYGHIKWIEDLVPRTIWIEEQIGFDKQIILITELKIVEWHNYKYLDWITVRRDGDKLYKFKEGDFKRLRIQDIEDMLLLLRRMEDLQLGVESYQKKLNLTKPDSYRSDLKRKDAYTAYSNPRGFIYKNKDKRNMLMRIDELHKFSDGTLTDVHTALDDRLKGIQMQYLTQSIWRKSDKDRAATMIQAIDKRLKTRRIMKSLERFVEGRLYEGDFRMLQRTI
nr:hypothetical protein [Tanacetum cinerariifolium]